MEDKVLYFGFGANRDPRMMAAITGNENLVGRPGILMGYKLCVQRLDQIPEMARAKIIASGWPSTFTSYVIKRRSVKGRGSMVRGTIWELTPRERELVRNWELIDDGWQQDVEGMAVTVDRQEIAVVTEGLREGQEVDRRVDGYIYKTWLQPAEEFVRNATRTRERYFKRQQEGSSIELERQG